MRPRAARAALNDYLAFTNLAFRWTETLIASSQVIAHRSARSNTPVQLFEMVNEKAIAGLQASQAMAAHMARAQGATAPALFGAWVRLVSSGLAPYHARAVHNARRSRRNKL